MGFLFNTKGSIISDYFKLVKNHANMQAGWVYDVMVCKDGLRIKQKVGGKAELMLKYDRISGVFHGRGNSGRINFIISYKSSVGEDEFIQFEDTRKYKGRKVATKLKEMCNIRSVSETTSNKTRFVRPSINVRGSQPRTDRAAWTVRGGRVYHLYSECPSCKRSGKTPTRTTVSRARASGLRECGMCQEMLDRARRL